MCQPPAVGAKMKGSTSLLCRKRTEKNGSERQLCLSGQDGAGGSEERVHGAPKQVRDWVTKVPPGV